MNKLKLTHEQEQEIKNLKQEGIKIKQEYLQAKTDLETAEQLNKSIDGYLKDSFKEQLLKINNEFLGEVKTA